MEDTSKMEKWIEALNITIAMDLTEIESREIFDKVVEKVEGYDVQCVADLIRDKVTQFRDFKVKIDQILCDITEEESFKQFHYDPELTDVRMEEYLLEAVESLMT